ncbi:FtsW/RodA/SpoVE family cell cycle protein [Limnochorda pilosa]|nr:FtsW/RodA/SpoVE family cell cycle protein [Limnochorda pilosa]
MVLAGGLARLGVAALGSHLPLVAGFALWSAGVVAAAWMACGREGARLMAAAGGLAAGGLLVARGTQPEQVATQALLWLGSSGLALVATAVPWRRLARYPRTAGLASLVLLVLPLAVGVEAGGARAWLRWGVLHFQPAEVARVLAILFVAGLLAEGVGRGGRGSPAAGIERPWRPDRAAMLPAGAGWLLLAAVLVAQRDLGGAALLYGLLPAAWLLAGGRWLTAAAAVGLGAAGAVGLATLFHHATARVAAWADPWGQLSTGGYQVLQGLASLRLGGLWGVGARLTAGSAVPAAATDLPLAVIAEGAGLVAVLGILYLEWWIVDGGLRAAGRAQDLLTRVLTGSAALLWGLETLVPVAGWLGVVPLTGLPLPLVSRGGTALLAHGILLGWMLWALRAGRGRRRPSGACEA